MTVDDNAPSEDGEAPTTKELQRELLAQLYERAVERYGSESEQARMLSQFLNEE